MGRFIFIFLLFSLVLNLGAQSFQTEYTVRDSLIQDAMKSEAYDFAVGLMEQQFDLIKESNLQDSLYHYCYNYGRATWKTSGPEKGIYAATKISNEVKEKDTAVRHYLQTLNDLTWLYYETGNVKECLRVDSTYLAICLQNKNIPVDLISMAYYNLGFDFLEFGNYLKSLEHFQSSADVILNSADSLNDRLSMSYNAIGAVQWRLGDLDEAKKSYEKSLELIANNTDPKSQLEKGNILGNIALILHDNGELIKAKEMQEEFIRIDSKALPLIDDPYLKETALRRMSSAYINLADIYFNMGEYSKARRLIELAISEREKILEPDDPSLVSAIEHLADLELRSGNYTEAETKFFNYLAYCRKNFGEQSAFTAWALKSLGLFFMQTGDVKQSEEYFNQAIASQVAVGNPLSDPALALMYRERASLFAMTKNFSMALKDLKKSLQIYSKSREEDNNVFAEIYLEMAEVKLNAGDFSDAEKDVNHALILLNGNEKLKMSPYLFPQAYYLKAKLKSKESADTSARESALNDLETAIQFLKSNKHMFQDEESKLMLYEAHKKIFELAEEMAFSLYEMTNDTKWVDTFFGLTEENRTILLRNHLQNFSSLDFAGVPDSILRQERNLLTKLNNEDVQVMQDVVSLERQYVALVNYIRENYPEYYALKYSDQSFSIQEVQDRLFDEAISLLVYSLTDEFIYALLIEQNSAKLFRLEKGNVVDEIHELNKALVNRDKPVFDSLSATLYQHLFAPVQPSIQQHELIIVPDEELFFLNFEVLPDQLSEASVNGNRMLINAYTISYYLSTTVAMQFKNLAENKTSRLLTFAPGFSDRQKRAYQHSVADSSLIDKKFLSYIQQPFAVQTAKNIAGVFSGTSFLEDDADETTFKKESGKYGIIHLGTHAEINQKSPLMSHLVLSKSMKNDSLDDGYLHAYEIYQMPLQAELAVLTACETGVGKQQNSEGVISLAHSFSYAGCRSIVMSLWSIDEKTSASIISDFYHYLAEGMHKNMALRQAKLDYLEHASTELQFPYYWAGLVLIGDHNPVIVETGFNWFGLTVVTIALILFLGFFFRKKSKS